MSAPLPPDLGRAFERHALASGRAAWLLVDERHRIVDAGGELAHFGVASPAAGRPLRELDEVLDTVLGTHDDYEVLPRVELRPGLAADVHRGSLEGGERFLLLFDVTADASSETRLRQRGVDLTRLLRGLGGDEAQRSRIGRGWGQLRRRVEAEGPLRLARVAALRVRLVDPLAPPDGDVDELLARREAVLARVLEALLERTGMAELDGCWSVQSWCGVGLELPDAAARALEVAAGLPALFRPEEGPVPLAVGVATGPAAVGLLALPGGRRLAVLGECCERALLLAEAARPGDVLVDGETATSAPPAGAALEPAEEPREAWRLAR